MSKKFKRINSIILCLAMLMSVYVLSGNTTVSAATQNTTTGQWVYTSVQQSSGHGLSALGGGTYTYGYNVNGFEGFCIQASKKPVDGSSVLCRYMIPGNSCNAELRKILYGYVNGKISSQIESAVTSQGLSYKSTDDFAIVHFLLSVVYAGDYGAVTGTYYKGAIDSLRSKIKSMTYTVPDDWECYLVQPQDDSRQTLLIVPGNEFTIIKTDSVTGKALSGAKFHIYYEPNGSSSLGSETGRGVYTTDSNGKVTIQLPPGRYKIVEEAAPTGYQKSSEVKYVTLSGGSGTHSASVSFKNTPLIKLELTKQSSTSKEYSLKGAEYGVYTDSKCTNYKGWIVTDEDGYGYFGDSNDKSKGNGEVKHVVKSDYWVKEIKAPKGYELDTRVYKFVSIGRNDKYGCPIYAPDNFIDGKSRVTDNPAIKLQLLKNSANCDLTNDNSLYSLEGAKYNIYTDKACTKYYGWIVTDKDGYGYFGDGNNPDTGNGGGSGTNTDTKDKDTIAYKKISGINIALKGNITFYCKEAKAPKGYKLNDTVYQFKDSGSVSSDGIKIYRAYSLDDNSEPTDYPINDPIGIVLQKRNSVTGETENQGLEGAVFEVQYYAQEIDKDYDVSSGETAPALDSETLKRTWYIKTDEDGTTWLHEDYLADNESYVSDDFYFATNSGNPALPMGTVVIKEVEAPPGYALSDITFYRPISEEKALIAEDTNTPLEVPIDEMPAVGYIGIHKMNNNRQGIANAVYGLYATERAEGTPLSTLTTDKDGNGIFDYSAPIGTTLYIKEIKAPTGYQLDSTVYPITATVENLTVETAVIQEIFEDSVKGDILIKKSSEDGIVKNLWFAVIDDMGNEYNPVVTDDKGEAAITGLPVYKPNGSKINYTIKELGFKVEKTTLSYGGYTWKIDINKCIKYKNVYYEGIANNVYTSTNSKIPAYSRYYYGDSATAIKNQNGITQTLTDNGSVTYSFINKVKFAEIEVNKKSFDNDVYRLFFSVSDQFGATYGNLITNANGYASTKDWDDNDLKAAMAISNSSVFIPINYKITELGFKNPGSGTFYLPDKYKEAFKSSYQYCDAKTGKYTLTWDAYNEADTGEINILKSSEDGEIENLCFEISAWDEEAYSGVEETYLGYDEYGNRLHSIVVKTDKDGNATSDSVQVYDVNGNKMDGLYVYLENSNNDEISYNVKELGYDNGDGSYVLPDRYISNESDYLYLIDNRSVTYECVNSLKKGQLQIKKTSEDNIVSGMWFNIKSAYVDLDVVTDDNGFTDVIDNLDIYKKSVGNDNELVVYTITELGVKTYDDNGNWTGYQLPNRYIKPSAKTITLSNDTTQIKTISFANRLITGSVVLHKQTGDGKSLSGSEWELYKENTEGIGELVKLTQTGVGLYGIYGNGKVSSLQTNSDGELNVYNLPFGSYYFVEKTAPNGYMPYGEKIYFTIQANEETVSVTYDFTVKDNKRILPNTGDIGVVPIYVLGGVVSVIAGIFIFIYCKKRKTERGIKDEKL